ncbi:hypothetical protein PAMA_005053 [Pampus argenteus]
MSFPGAAAASLALSEPLRVLDDHSQPPSKYSVKCEYCRGDARPSLDLTWVEELQAVPLFCCAHRQQLYKMLMKQRCLVERRCELVTGSLTSEEENPSTALEELLFQGREMDDHNKFIVDLPKGLGCPNIKGPQLSALLRSRKRMLDSDGEGFLQKYYSNGMKFLTLFPDGSAQVFYPSGLLALVILVTKENGRVCIVYDDSDAPNQPIRAVFQSDGRATCYYSNGNIWVTLNRSGGQCLDEMGARVRRWRWSSPGLSPTPLLPVFLSLNKTVGVRVLGKEQVFVSFLARGQQAKGGMSLRGEVKSDGGIQSVLAVCLPSAQTFINITSQPSEKTTSKPRQEEIVR